MLRTNRLGPWPFVPAAVGNAVPDRSHVSGSDR